MGRQYVANTVKSTIDTTTDIIIGQAQTCTNIVQQSTNFSCTAGGDIDIQGTINLINQGRLNIACVQTAVSNVNFNESIKNSIDQQVKAIAQAFNLTGGQDVQQLTDAVNKISLAIQSDITQQCAQFATQNASFQCGAGGDVTVGGQAVINISNYTDAVATCTANQGTAISASIDLQQLITQKADAEIESLITQLAWLLLAAALLVALVLFGPELAASGEGGSIIKWILIAVGVIIAYLAAAYFFGLWPFNSSSS